MLILLGNITKIDECEFINSLNLEQLIEDNYNLDKEITSVKKEVEIPDLNFNLSSNKNKGN